MHLELVAHLEVARRAVSISLVAFLFKRYFLQVVAVCFALERVEVVLLAFDSRHQVVDLVLD